MNDPLHAAVIDEQASLWAARLDAGQLSAADRAELESWLSQDPARPALLARYTELSSDLALSLPELAAVGLVEHPAPPARPGYRRGWVLGTVGGLAVAALLAALWFNRAGLRPENLSAPTGERRTFTLADGSRVELNANTSVFIENGQGERRVRLSNGEAFFEVSKDPSRPFIVETPAGSVRVTGTKFNVLTEAATQLEVTVLEGSVQVHPGDAVLHHGDQLTEAKDGVEVQGLTDEQLDDTLAWRRGQIVCNGLPLGTVLARLAHFHGIAIAATPAAAALRFSGRYSLGNLDDFLVQLEQSRKVRVAHSADGSIRVSELGEP